MKLLNPIAPHITEELYHEVLGNTESIAYSEWPKADESKTKDDTLTIIVSVNGKMRDKIEVSHPATNEEIEKLALDSAKVKTFLISPIKKVIYVPGKIVNIVL